MIVATLGSSENIESLMKKPRTRPKFIVPKKWELFLGGGNRVSAADNSLLGTISIKQVIDSAL